MRYSPLLFLENSEPLAISFDAMLAYHGHQAPGGVAHATAFLSRALPLLSVSPPERREISIATAFGGPGVRDAVEMATRAVTGGRFTVDPGLAKPERGIVLANYVFVVSYRETSVTLQLRDNGFVVEEFITLSRKEGKTADELLRVRQLKLEMTERIITRQPHEVYELVD